MCMLHFRHSDSSVRYRSRPVKDGPEARMLEMFMSQYEKRLKGDGGDYAIFYEPQMPTGYPDCVIVKFDASAYDGWSKSAVPLSDVDMRILHVLVLSRGLTAGTLARKSGFGLGVINKALENLRGRGFVEARGSRWVAAPRRRCLGIRNILSIEAKMSDCSGVLDQAVLNKTFANSSCVLMPTRRPSHETLSVAKDSGLGIYLQPEQGHAEQVLKPDSCGGMRASYAIWRFNEWIGRRLAKNRRNTR